MLHRQGLRPPDRSGIGLHKKRGAGYQIEAGAAWDYIKDRSSLKDLAGQCCHNEKGYIPDAEVGRYPGKEYQRNRQMNTKEPFGRKFFRLVPQMPEKQVNHYR